jgi:hypothetical protein
MSKTSIFGVRWFGSPAPVLLVLGKNRNVIFEVPKNLDKNYVDVYTCYLQSSLDNMLS